MCSDSRRRPRISSDTYRCRKYAREKRRQAVGQCRIDQKRDPALRDSADFADGKRNLVGGEGDRLHPNRLGLMAMGYAIDLDALAR